MSEKLSKIGQVFWDMEERFLDGLGRALDKFIHEKEAREAQETKNKEEKKL